MAAEKFRIDDIVLEEHRDMAKQFDCAVCLHIAQEPVVQTPCGHIYCQACVEQCSLCPQCREPLGEEPLKRLNEANKLAMRIMHEIKVRCPFSEPASDSEMGQRRKRPRCELTPASVSGAAKCVWQGSYGDLLAKHVGVCQWVRLTCPAGCGASYFRFNQEEHRRQCARGGEVCSICFERLQVGSLEAHNKERAEAHVELLQARLADREDAGREARQGLAQEVAGLRGEVQELRRRLLAAEDMCASWPLHDIAARRANFSRAECLHSSNFDLAGVGPFWLQFYPRGDQDSARGNCAVFVFCEVKVLVSFILWVDGHERDESDEENEQNDPYWCRQTDVVVGPEFGYGESDFGPSPDAENTTDGCWTLFFKLLSVSKITEVEDFD